MAPFDSYHGDTHNQALGLRLDQMLRTERIGACCIRCDKFRVYDWSTFRHFRRDMPVSWLTEHLARYCDRTMDRALCGLWIVSPDDGCSDVG